MTIQVDVAVTYVGRDNPFKDRTYRSGLTFTPGQTRLVPETLAARFLRHSDVFRRAEVKPATSSTTPPAALLGGTVVQADANTAKLQAAQSEGQPPAGDQVQQQEGEQTKPVDDTQALLDAAKKEADGARDLDDARFEMLEAIETMDRNALIDWADVNYKQKIPGNASVAKARDMARGFVDQYGLPA